MAGDEFDCTHMDRCSSEALPADLISAQTDSATASDTPMAASIAPAPAGGRAAGVVTGRRRLRAEYVRRFDEADRGLRTPVGFV